MQYQDKKGGKKTSKSRNFKSAFPGKTRNLMVYNNNLLSFSTIIICTGKQYCMHRKQFYRAYVSQSMGSNLCDSRLNKPSRRSPVGDLAWASFFLLNGTLIFDSLEGTSVILISPPDKTSAANLRSNKICKIPFSDT